MASARAVRPKPDRVLSDLSLAIEHPERIEGFSPRLSWSHYHALTKVEARPERLFYEIEAGKEGWSVPHLERQIDTMLFARLTVDIIVRPAVPFEAMRRNRIKKDISGVSFRFASIEDLKSLKTGTGRKQDGRTILCRTKPFHQFREKK